MEVDEDLKMWLKILGIVFCIAVVFLFCWACLKGIWRSDKNFQRSDNLKITFEGSTYWPYSKQPLDVIKNSEQNITNHGSSVILIEENITERETSADTNINIAASVSDEAIDTKNSSQKNNSANIRNSILEDTDDSSFKPEPGICHKCMRNMGRINDEEEFDSSIRCSCGNKEEIRNMDAIFIENSADRYLVGEESSKMESDGEKIKGGVSFTDENQNIVIDLTEL